MIVVLTKKFLDTQNPNLIKVQNDAGLNRLVSLTIILFFLSGTTIRETNLHFKSLEGHLLIREIPPNFVPKKVLTSLSTKSKKGLPPNRA